MLVVSPTSVLHVIPADKKSTSAFIKKHTDIKRHDYFRGMAGLDLNNARNQSYHWTRLDNVEWIWHKKLGAIVAVTTATALHKNGPAICAASGLPPGTLTFPSYKNVAALLAGVPPPARWLARAHTAPPIVFCRILSVGPPSP